LGVFSSPVNTTELLYLLCIYTFHYDLYLANIFGTVGLLADVKKSLSPKLTFIMTTTIISQVTTDLAGYRDMFSFGNRIWKQWNHLPGNVVSSLSVNIFKGKPRQLP